jgi:hypothetical protein
MVEGGYLDPAVTRPYGGSKEKKGENIKENHRAPAQPLAQAWWIETGVLGLGFNPNRQKKKNYQIWCTRRSS